MYSHEFRLLKTVSKIKILSSILVQKLEPVNPSIRIQNDELVATWSTPGAWWADLDLTR
jgi:hypothetical protein